MEYRRGFGDPLCVSSKTTPTPGLIRLLNAQGGVITRTQALGIGVTEARIDRLLSAGHWRRVHPGIYSAFGPPAGVARAWVGVLAGGAGACVGGWGAAHLLGLVPTCPDRVEIWSERQLRDRGFLVFRRGHRPSTGSPPRARAAATIVDLAAEINEDRLVTLLAEAAFKRITTPDDVLAELAGRGRHPARKLLRTLLGDVANGVMSPLERRYLIHVERAHGLPEGVRQALVGAPVDVAYPGYQVVIELDGAQWHAGARSRRDADRDHLRAASGVITLRFTWADVVTRPCEVAVQVVAVLRGRGWTGEAHRCARCRNAAVV